MFDAPLEDLSAALKIVQNGAILVEKCSLKIGSTGWAAEAAAGKGGVPHRQGAKKLLRKA